MALAMAACSYGVSVGKTLAQTAPVSIQGYHGYWQKMLGWGQGEGYLA